MKDSTTKNKRSLNKLVVLLFWIGVWQISYLLIQRDIYVPSPFQVFSRLHELVLLPSFWSSVAMSMYRVLVGLFLSILLGVIAGVLSGIYPYLHDLIQPAVVVIKSTPVLSFIIIALIWFSSSDVPIFSTFLMCFPVIWTNIVAGIHHVDPKLLEMAKIYQVKRSLVLRKIYIPSITPYFSAACITCLGLGWKVSVAAEVLSHPRNAIGSQLYSAKVYLDSAELFAWTLVVVLLSLLFELLFTQLVQKVTIKAPAGKHTDMDRG